MIFCNYNYQKLELHYRGRVILTKKSIWIGQDNPEFNFRSINYTYASFILHNSFLVFQGMSTHIKFNEFYIKIYEQRI